MKVETEPNLMCLRVKISMGKLLEKKNTIEERSDRLDDKMKTKHSRYT